MIYRTLLICGVAFPACFAASASAQPRAFSIPALPANEAIMEFARQSGAHIIADGRYLRSIRLNALDEQAEVPDALNKLLKGTRLRSVRTPGGAYAVKLAGLFAAAAPRDQLENAPSRTSPPTQPVQATSAIVSEDEILVTARKREERLQDIPLSIVALDENQIRDARVELVDDLSAHVPNLTIVTRTDATPDVTLRGIGSFGVIQSVGFYVNDVQQFDGQTSRFRDIGQIEVLKGPQGTLYSGSNIGGAIRFTTKRPTDRFEGEVAVEYGTDNFVSGEAILSGPISENLGARILMYGDRSDGAIFNIARDKKAGPHWIYGARLTLELGAGTDTTAALFVDVNKQKRRDITNLFITPNDNTYSRNINLDNQPLLDRRIQSATLDVRHRMGDLELVSLTSGFHSYDRKFADFDFTEVQILDIDALRKRNAISQELRLGTTGNNAFNWLVGAFGQYFELSNRTGLEFMGAPLGTVGQDEKRRQLAVFGNGELVLGDWMIEAGARYEWDSNKLTVFGSGDTGRVVENEILYRGSLSYKPSQNLMLYTTVAKGFTPGDLVREGDFAIPYNKETAISIEAGLKGSALDNRLRFEAAAFAIWYDDRLFQTNVFREQVEYVTITNNIGDSRNLGFEVSGSFGVTPYFTIGGALGVTKGEWTAATITEPNSGNPNFVLDGLDVPFTPNYQGNAYADWRVPLSGDAELGFRADVSLIGRKYWNLATTTQQRGYQLVNLSARLKLSRWELSVSAKNIFDEPYNTLFQTAAEIGNNAGPGFGTLGQPRQIIATVRTRF